MSVFVGFERFQGNISLYSGERDRTDTIYYGATSRRFLFGRINAKFTVVPKLEVASLNEYEHCQDYSDNVAFKTG